MLKLSQEVKLLGVQSRFEQVRGRKFTEGEKVFLSTLSKGTLRNMYRHPDLEHIANLLEEAFLTAAIK